MYKFVNTLCQPYIIVPYDSSRQTMIDNNICNRLTTFITEIDAKCRSNCYILLAGDFNSRTSDSPDYVVDDSNNSNLDFLPDDYIADVEIKRNIITR